MERGSFVEVSFFPGERNTTKLLDGEEAYLIFYCCTVHFDNVQNSFHQQMHTLLNI
jgi:hypothetical protein